MRILLVEDDPMIGAAVHAGLQYAGFAADWVCDGEAADTALQLHPYDALVLDLGLPRRGGLDVLRRLRSRGHPLPVLIATARDAVADRISGLDAGADDYLVKPFDLDELAARLRALIRRASGRPEPVLKVVDLEISFSRRTVSRAGEVIALSGREWAVLEALSDRPGQVLSRTQIEEKLYAWGDEPSSNAVEVHIHGLRRKLGAGSILTVRGVGYRMADG